MTTSPQLTAIIYTRVSNDPSGKARSVGEQEADCRAVCAREGWTVADVVSDNDQGASRWSTAQRPGFRSLASKLTSGHVLVTWESSRGYRDLADYVVIRDLCDSKGVLLNYSGRTYDLARGEDRFQTAMDALIAERYAEELRSRILRAQGANLDAGKPHGRIPYGFVRIDGRQIPDEQQALIVKKIYDRVLQGVSMYRICQDLNERGVPAPAIRAADRATQKWTPQAVSRVIRRPANAGLLIHKGEVVGPGNWEPLIDEDRWRTAIAMVTRDQPKSNYGRHTPRYLLTGIAVCSVCGGGAVRVKSGKTTDSYQCPAPAHHAQRSMRVVDGLVERVMLLLLADPGVAQRIEASDIDHARIVAQQAEGVRLRAELDEQITAVVAQGLPAASTASALRALSDRFQPLIDAAEHVMLPAGAGPLPGLVGPNAAQRWGALELMEKREAIRAALNIEIVPVGKGRYLKRREDHGVNITWRV